MSAMQCHNQNHLHLPRTHHVQDTDLVTLVLRHTHTHTNSQAVLVVVQYCNYAVCLQGLSRRDIVHQTTLGSRHEDKVFITGTGSYFLASTTAVC